MRPRFHGTGLVPDNVDVNLVPTPFTVKTSVAGTTDVPKDAADLVDAAYDYVNFEARLAAIAGVAAFAYGLYSANPAQNTTLTTYIDPGATQVKTYTIRNSVATAGQVKRGATADATMQNLVNAINNSGGSPGVGGDYLPIAGAAHPYVSASLDTGTGTLTLTALTLGVAGNNYVMSGNVFDVDAFTFSGNNAGVDPVDAGEWGVTVTPLAPSGVKVCDVRGRFLSPNGVLLVVPNASIDTSA